MIYLVIILIGLTIFLALDLFQASVERARDIYTLILFWVLFILIAIALVFIILGAILN